MNPGHWVRSLIRARRGGPGGRRAVATPPRWRPGTRRDTGTRPAWCRASKAARPAIPPRRQQAPQSDAKGDSERGEESQRPCRTCPEHCRGGCASQRHCVSDCHPFASLWASAYLVARHDVRGVVRGCAPRNDVSPASFLRLEAPPVRTGHSPRYLLDTRAGRVVRLHRLYNF